MNWTHFMPNIFYLHYTTSYSSFLMIFCFCRYLHYDRNQLNAISTSNHMFKKKIWDKFTEFTFLKFWNLPSETRAISKFQKMNEVNFPQISRINMLFLVNHMWQALQEHTRVRITQKTINVNKFNKHNSITPTLQ